jgi:hypothetical protein
MSLRRLCPTVTACLCMVYRALFLFALLICCCTANISAQGSNATINGQITDSAGRIVPGTEVQAVNIDTNVVYPSKSNGSGIYVVSGLIPGRYRLMVRKDGFKIINKTDITLHVQDILEQNFALEVGPVSESITVEGDGQQINTTDASVSTVIDRKFVENIPLNGRSFQDLISMTPGVVTQSPQSGSGVGYSGDFSINGQRTESNYYMVDGVSANLNAGNGYGGEGGSSGNGTTAASTALGTTQSLISVDALQEFRVQSSTYSAEFGHSPGGQLSFVTRSGTNGVHGSAFDYLRNNFFDANDWFNDAYQKPAPALRQNDFGGTLGGPIFIPKFYDGRSKSFFFVSYEGLRLVQPQAASTLYVPDTYMRKEAALALQPILNAFPKQNGIDYGTQTNPGLAQFILPYSLPSSINSTSVRLDQVVSPQLTLFFRVGITPSDTNSRSLSSVTPTKSNTQSYTIGATSKLSKIVDNEFRIGYTRANSSEDGYLDGFGGAAPINLAAAMGAGSFANTEPAFVIYSPQTGISSLETINSSNRGRQLNVVDTLSVLRGQHHLKFGIDYRRIEVELVPVSHLPEAEFVSNQSLINDTTDFFLIENNIGATPIFNDLSVFAQDEWRIAARLNLSLGLRWDLAPPPTEQHGNDAYTLLGSVANPSTLSLAPQGTPLWHTYKYNFAPRLGAAWTAHSNPGWETVVRTGGGAFFDTANEAATQGYQGLGFSAYQIYSGSPLPGTPAQYNFTPSTMPPYTSGAILAFPAHLQLPYTLEWNVSLQQALGKAQTATISYVGSNGRRLINEQELSLNSFNPNFGSVYVFPTGITSNYQALQVQFQRSVVHGLQALASYTWSHSMDYGSSYQSLALVRGNSDFDVRNNFSGGVTWNLPAANVNTVVDEILNGWAIDGRATARTAFPVTLQGNFLIDPSNGNGYYGGVNLVPGVPTYLYGAQCPNLPRSQCPGGRVVNQAAFEAVTSGASGNAPRNFVRGFGATQVNLAVRRDVHLYENLSLQFRAESFNILNHPNFGYVDPYLTDATFGQATQMLNQSLGTLASQYQQGGPRSMQFALKLMF